MPPDATHRETPPPPGGDPIHSLEPLRLEQLIQIREWRLRLLGGEDLVERIRALPVAELIQLDEELIAAHNLVYARVLRMLPRPPEGSPLDDRAIHEATVA